LWHPGPMERTDFRMLKCATPGIEAVFANSAHSFSRHTHDQFGFGAIRAGGQRWHSDKKLVEAIAGDAIAVNPGEVHDGAPLGDRGRCWAMLYIDPQAMYRAASDIFGESAGEFEVAKPVLEDARAALIFWELLAAEADAGEEDVRREELLLGLTALIGPYQPPARPVVSTVAAARARIDDDPAASLTLADLSDTCGISRFQAIRAFRKETGLTPHAYLIQRRIDLVRSMISQGDSLAAAAAAAGFADQSHMTRAFRMKYGLTPGAYARALSA
jgi:AraC-like DNA-binding protein